MFLLHSEAPVAISKLVKFAPLSDSFAASSNVSPDKTKYICPAFGKFFCQIVSPVFELKALIVKELAAFPVSSDGVRVAAMTILPLETGGAAISPPSSAFQLTLPVDESRLINVASDNEKMRLFELTVGEMFVSIAVSYFQHC
jgi:hypothetical protein